jgi:hypothetical protein
MNWPTIYKFGRAATLIYAALLILLLSDGLTRERRYSHLFFESAYVEHAMCRDH